MVKQFPVNYGYKHLSPLQGPFGEWEDFLREEKTDEEKQMAEGLSLATLRH